MNCYTHYHSVLTNGTDEIEIQCGRYDCGITPAPGQVFSVINGEYYINGKRAWVEVKEAE